MSQTAKEKLEAKKAKQSESQLETEIVPLKLAKGKLTIEQILFEAITHLTKIVAANHICFINGTNFLTDGELSTVSGPPKTGKSTVVSYIIATALMKFIPDDVDTLKIRTQYTTKNIIYIDTEQNISGTALTLQRVLKIAGLTECPTNLKYFNVRKYSIEERIEHLRVILDNLSDIAFVVIDGITDYVTGVNDEISSNQVIEMLMNYSSMLNIPILNIIHETAGGKIRGQLGSQLERKVGGAISIHKDRDRKCFIIKPKFIRYGADFDDIYYQYLFETGLIECLTDEQINLIKKSEKDETDKSIQLKSILEKVFNGSSDGIKGTDIRKLIAKHQTNKAGATADSIKGVASRNLKRMIELELVEVRDDNLHYYEGETKDLFNNQVEPNF